MHVCLFDKWAKMERDGQRLYENHPSQPKPFQLNISQFDAAMPPAVTECMAKNLDYQMQNAMITRSRACTTSKPSTTFATWGRFGKQVLQNDLKESMRLYGALAAWINHPQGERL